jgi:hypothetical protein
MDRVLKVLLVIALLVLIGKEVVGHVDAQNHGCGLRRDNPCYIKVL